MTDEQRGKKMALLSNQANLLMDSFDSVQIFCTKYEGGDTAQYSFGSGNFMTRYGHVRSWLLKEDGRSMGVHNE